VDAILSIDGPGAPITDPATRGTGACTGRTLAEVITAVDALVPALADIQAIYDPANPLRTSAFGLDIRPYASSDGFTLVFHRGNGDCPSGCINNEYWYFVTDDQCQPQIAGHYRRDFIDGGNCYVQEGTPLWESPIDPSAICGAQDRAQDIAGTYHLHAFGTQRACWDGTGPEPAVEVSRDLTLELTQVPGNLSQGTAIVEGTGDARIDGQPLAMKVVRRRLTATRTIGNQPAVCPDESGTSLQLDLEIPLTGLLHFTEYRALACPPAQRFCRGGLWLDVTRVP
jgi:hypothetical protein